MKTKQLGNSDFFITPVRFGSSAWEQSFAPIHRALELLGRISPIAALVLAVVLVAVIAWFAEVHHRVKNNLQVIFSLLMLQAEKLSNAADRAVFDECRDRIYSMARLHEQLYSSGEFSDLDFAAHLREMAEMLVRSHTPQ